MKYAIALLTFFALMVAVDGREKADVFPGSPVVAIKPCSECNVKSEGLCFVVMYSDRGYALPVEKVKGFAFVSEAQEL
jgi:hypothetical protein